MVKKTKKEMPAADGRYHFDIPIGDWSDDGHGKCEYYQASAAKSFVDVCKAFAAARLLWKLEDGRPFTVEDVCSEYEEREVEDDVVKFLKSKGFKINKDDFYTREMAELVVWFLNQGDETLDAKLQPEAEQRPMLRNWDFCDAMGVGTASGKGLEGFGYGLFGS
jgi:hypothetical protein